MAWFTTRQIVERLPCSRDWLRRWVRNSRRSQEFDDGYFPIDLTAIEGHHYRKVKTHCGGFGWRYEFNSDFVHVSLVRRAKEHMRKYRIKNWRSREGKAEHESQVPVLEKRLRGQKFLCKTMGKITLERCQMCYLCKPLKEREGLNWEQCRKEHTADSKRRSDE